MTTVSVFGYKHSGKTTVSIMLLEQLAKRGTVAYRKHTHSPIKLEMHLKTATFTQWSAIVDQQGFALVATKQLPELTPVDFLVVEGYIPDVPNVLCVRNETELKRATPLTMVVASLTKVPGTVTPEEAVQTAVAILMQRQL